MENSLILPCGPVICEEDKYCVKIRIEGFFCADLIKDFRAMQSLIKELVVVSNWHYQIKCDNCSDRNL